jgi:hypothetical protein
MKYHNEDQDLVLFAHRELPTGRALLTQAHLLFCPRCRARLQQFQGVSRAIAQEIRGPGLPVWPALTPGLAPAARMATGWLLVAAVLAVLSLLIVAGITQVAGRRAARSHASAPSAQRQVPRTGCRPDLPTDACR